MVGFTPARREVTCRARIKKGALASLQHNQQSLGEANLGKAKLYFGYFKIGQRDFRRFS